MAKRKINFSSILSPIGRHKIITIILLIVLIFLGSLVYRLELSPYIQQRHFNEADSALNDVYSDIFKDAGSPLYSDHSGDCAGFRGDFGEEGPNICNLGYIAYFSVQDQNSSDKKRGEILAVIRKNFDLLSPISAPTSSINTDAPGSNIIRKYYKVKGGLNCEFSFYYDNAFDGDKVKLPKLNDLQLLEVSTRCSDHGFSIY